jgi:hypothetical protein
MLLIASSIKPSPLPIFLFCLLHMGEAVLLFFCVFSKFFFAKHLHFLQICRHAFLCYLSLDVSPKQI